jgi:hypothetical protein
MFRINGLLGLCVAITFIASIVGCTTLTDAQAARGRGPNMSFNKDRDTVWAAVIESVEEIEYGGFKISSKNKDEGYVYIERGANSFSSGEKIAIFIDSVPNQIKTRVEIIRQPALKGSKYETLWDARLFKSLESKLK